MCSCSNDGRPAMLDRDYLATAASPTTKVELVIIGRDPYPGAVGEVPFMKPTWLEMKRKSYAGYWVLRSITGVGPGLLSVRHGSLALEKYAREVLLLKHGVVLLNSSYCFRDGKAPLKQDVITAWNQINSGIVTRALANGAHVLLCGPDAWRMCAWIPALLVPEVHKVWHPKQRNKKKWKNPQWRNWWTRGAIKKWLSVY